MIRDLMQEKPQPDQRAQICIVGAGAAGIVLAVELSRRGKQVVLLEGGGHAVEEESQHVYGSESPDLPHRGLHEGRVRALGGTTTKWGGQILELDALDFERRPWVAESGWPFPKSELTRHYARALELEGVATSLLEDAAVWKALGMDSPEFAPLCLYFSRWCPEPNFAQLHRVALEGPKIDVWVHANAVELVMEDGQAKGVRCKTLGGTEAVFVADEYIFCLGAIESSRFFLQPRNEALPWNRSGLLGQHFQDHIDCTAALIEPLSAARFHDSFDAVFLRGYKYNPKLKLDSATQQREQLLQVGATFFSSDEDESLPAIKNTAKNLLRGRFGSVSAADALQLLRHGPALLRNAYRYAVEHRAYHAPKAQMKMRVHCEQEPSGSSAITLSDQRDEFGLLRTRLSWKISELELRTIRGMVQTAQKALHGVARLVPDAELMNGDPNFVARCEDSFHHMGGMRMDAEERCGVVDPNLRLHGTKNVHVCSSAVFPTSGFSNPTHTLLALAVRLAEHLAK